MIARLLIALLGLFLLAACAPEEGPVTTVGPEAGPAEVVASLFEAIEEGRFEDTVALTDAEQTGLVTLAEGADATDVVDVLEDGGAAVTSNFWSGFAQTLDAETLAANRDIQVAGTTTVDGVEFARVVVTLEEATQSQTFLLRRDERWVIDMMATFGPVLAERLVPAVEDLLSSANSNASSVLARLNDAVPSLRAAMEQLELPSGTHQAMLGLIERVTRAG